MINCKRVKHANFDHAKRCYAWSYVENDEPQYVTVLAVLEIPPVDSAETAVKIAIAAKAKEK